MRIKKHPNKNSYMLAGGAWIRDFTAKSAPQEDINELVSAQDYELILYNELQNKLARLPGLDPSSLHHRSAVIVSDGHGFDAKHRLLDDLPTGTVIIAVNGALPRWVPSDRRRIGYYVANNPYPECMGYLPRHTRYFPRCVASTRTCPEFVRRYSKSGTVCLYAPTPDTRFAGMKNELPCRLDDYRNPICAAISLCYRAGTSRLLLLCCDEAIEGKKDGMIPIGDLWTYPQHLTSQGIIDANLHWLRSQEDFEVNVASHSDGAKYDNAPYIKSEEIIDFIKGPA